MNGVFVKGNVENVFPPSLAGKGRHWLVGIRGDDIFGSVGATAHQQRNAGCAAPTLLALEARALRLWRSLP